MKERSIRKASVLYNEEQDELKAPGHEENAKINTQFNAHEISINTQSSVYFLTFLVCIIFTPVFSISLFIHNELRLRACGMLSDNFVHNPRTRNRMLVGKQNNSNHLFTTGKKIPYQKLHMLAIKRYPRHIL